MTLTDTAWPVPRLLYPGFSSSFNASKYCGKMTMKMTMAMVKLLWRQCWWQRWWQCWVSSPKPSGSLSPFLPKPIDSTSLGRGFSPAQEVKEFHNVKVLKRKGNAKHLQVPGLEYWCQNPVLERVQNSNLRLSDWYYAKFQPKIIRFKLC